MAKEIDASIVVVRAVPLTRSLLPSATRQATAYVDAVVAGLREQDVDANGYLERGEPAAVITDLSYRLEADLIVMATRGRSRSGLGKFVLGSVATAVMATTSKPVLTLSEVEELAPVDEETRRQSAYLAKVLWSRESKGLYTHDQVQTQLVRLVEWGLDERVLLATYQGCRDEEESLDWLDLGFQAETLRKFLPDGADARESDESSDPGLTRAA
jgi:hypothetical protein